jgi:hypothetical protein
MLQLATKLPEIDFDSLNFGNYYINMHVITGRKPKYPRPGDMLVNGTRQGMTPSTYDFMYRLKSVKSNQWSRPVLDGNLASIIKELRPLHDGLGDFEIIAPSSPGISRPRLERKGGRKEKQFRDRSSA